MRDGESERKGEGFFFIYIRYIYIVNCRLFWSFIFTWLCLFGLNILVMWVKRLMYVKEC